MGKKEKVKKPTVLLVIDKTGEQMEEFLKNFEEMDDVVLMPNDLLTSTERWLFIRKAMNDKKKIILYSINGMRKGEVEENIDFISRSFRRQNVKNIIRIVLDNNLI